MIDKYKIITEQDVVRLNKKINKLVADGYLLVGPVQISPYDYGVRYCASLGYHYASTWE